MPFIKDDEKPPLLDERQSAQNAKAKWLAIAGATPFFGGAVTALTGVPLELTASPIALAAVMGAIVQIEENSVNRILDDPPRDDYLTPTKAKSKRYERGHLGSGDLALAVDNAAVAALRYTAYLEATVRADERAQGAKIAGNEEVAADRKFEAGIFLERARAANVFKAGALIDLAIVWAKFGSLIAAGGQLAGVREGATSARDAGLDRTRLVVRDLHLDRQITESARKTQIDAAADQREVSADELVFDAADRTQVLSRDSLRFYLDARSNMASELVTGRPRLGWSSRSVTEIESESASLEEGIAAWRRGDVGTALKVLEVASARVDIQNRSEGSVPLLEDAKRSETFELPPPRDESDDEEGR